LAIKRAQRIQGALDSMATSRDDHHQVSVNMPPPPSWSSRRIQELFNNLFYCGERISGNSRIKDVSTQQQQQPQSPSHRPEGFPPAIPPVIAQATEMPQLKVHHQNNDLPSQTVKVTDGHDMSEMVQAYLANEVQADVALACSYDGHFLETCPIVSSDQ